ncbi:helix-turn-helix domain-containing protein [Streptomyces caatingaensis]|uniref:DNA-binding protein n=1 Tax=Streptomyces caatingaensis TaxID=1678637 RepID=A0A0K9XFC5_9ACTN|nr:helix-turn-helix transcriptional regulator [Streptomyces caatingaensis]KNB52105.1 DNA-binding protein [Streptomyces caatingaensis]
MARQAPPNWRYCGNQVKLWRFRAGVSRERLAEEANYTVETVKAMEQGRRRPTRRLLEVADQLCGADGLLLAAVGYLAPEPPASNVEEFFTVEEEAVSIASYEPLFVPGLLQTEEYIRALVTSHWPPVEGDVIEERVAKRLKRQEKLTARPYSLFHYVIYEAALRSGIGGTAVMKGQLEHLLRVAEFPNVSLQVLPADTGQSIALVGPILVAETAEHQQLGYVEGLNTQVLHSDAATVSSFTQCLGRLRMEALGAEGSARFIRKLAEEL